jgi:hypothetical protein
MMTLRRIGEVALYGSLGFCSDVAATRFCLAASNRWIFQAMLCNLVLMTLQVLFVRKARSTPIMVAWIAGNLAGCWVALTL